MNYSYIVSIFQCYNERRGKEKSGLILKPWLYSLSYKKKMLFILSTLLFLLSLCDFFFISIAKENRSALGLQFFSVSTVYQEATTLQQLYHGQQDSRAQLFKANDVIS